MRPQIGSYASVNIHYGSAVRIRQERRTGKLLGKNNNTQINNQRSTEENRKSQQHDYEETIAEENLY